ncbi:Fe-S oxidoreductase [Paracidovorax citrulli]|uniref:Fe-S oxidoreductase n=3 Tax=Paracidovorax citrulli TaxID=80869 RepID=A1TIL1_PARC0|nr:hypothetical protein [Paracidovorax citrulli]ABM30799.1 putative Fe-S oxidoreductase [Paracidovorax citrulli AAC00-1]PVY64971.1 hypothetical protein C8E08_2318 [Paracidovorax citrulli]QCX10871.1 hypothetical protein APS58_2031 [Paracidovorax citrulli]REG70836.1 hypothetical protein C8E07_4055 [Paracidovorax citrulli]RLJ95388.1 hypothetical protein C8E06_4050 [Paracidovorax citrulli]
MPSSSIDPLLPPQGALARLFAEAALQRQGMLLGTDRGGDTAPSTPAPPHAPGAAAPPRPLPSTERVSVSPEARARADAALGPGPAAAPRPGAAVPGTTGHGSPGAGRPPAGLPGLAMPAPAAGTAPVDGAREAWPARGVGSPMRSLLGMLVHRMAEAGGPALRVVAAQPWTADMARALRAAMSAHGGPAALQTWRVGQGRVQAEGGERGFAFTLQVPSAWAARGAAAGADAGLAGAAASAGAQALAVPFPGRQVRLESGVFALVLHPARDGPGTPGRTSALLSLEFQPPPQQGLYGREWMQPALRADPWLQMAALEASGWRREDEEAEAAAHRGAVPPCDQPGCPYEGRAPCEQPFCLALRVEPRRPA